jgi:hypothetical protein
MKARLARLLSSRAFIVVAVALAVVLLLPTLRVGFMMDDYAQPSWLRGGPHATGGPRGVWDMFRFQDADRASFKLSLDRGFWPWWTNPELRLAFFRPLTSLTHALDHRLFPGGAAIMRLESILMYGAVVAIAGLLYRRFLGATVAFGLALLMYAIDDAHGVVVTWIADRNAVLAAGLGFGALLLHDRGVRDGDRRARIAAPIVFAVAVLAGEAALATLGYLLAHALWLQKARWPARLKTLAPYAGVVALWAVAYRALGYGASGGELYIDPGGEPVRFLGALATRLPILLYSQLSFPPSDLWIHVPPERQSVVFAVVLALVLLAAAVLALGLRRTRENGFFATGMLLALVPVCATWPSDRLLLFAGFGAFGLLGDFLTASRLELTHARRLVVRAAAGCFIVLHIAVAPLLYAGRAVLLDHMMHDPIERAAASLPPAAELAGKTVVIVNAPDFLIPSYALMTRAEHGEPLPPRIRQLTIAVQGRILLRRTGELRVELTLSKGFFHEPFSNVFRMADAKPALGELVQIAGMTATVKAYTSDRSHVATVEFEFDAPLDSPALVWVVWQETRFERFELPAIDEEVELPPIDYRKAMLGV